MADGDGGGGAGGGAGGQGAADKSILGQPTGGTGTPDWRAQIPEEYKNEASLASIKDIPSLVKGYVHAQKMVGADKILAPQKNWTEAQWNDFYNTIGRPKAADQYDYKLDKLPAGVKVDETKFKTTLTELHKIGLTQAQAKSVLDYYLNDAGATIKAETDARETVRNQAVDALKKEWGEKYDVNVDVARAVLGKFASPEVKQLMEESGMGNNPHLIRFFAKIGQGLLDDTAKGEGTGLITGGPAQAKQEIAKLTGDADFQKRLMNRGPGHQEAVDQWSNLHKQAYPEQKK